MPEPARSRVATVVAYGFGVLLLATIVIGGYQLAHEPEPVATRVIIGSQDQVYYYHRATSADARALGDTLRTIGFFRGTGSTVLLSKGTDGTLVSFVLNDGGWDHPETVYGFEQIGQRIAWVLGGFPIKVRLIDSKRLLHREMTVGKAPVGSRDAVYYFGSATEAEARTLGQALQAQGYLRDLGASVVLSKGDGTAIGFVVNDGVWDQPQAVAGFEQLVRAVAPSVGGLPVRLRLLNSEMEPKKTLSVSGG